MRACQSDGRWPPAREVCAPSSVVHYRHAHLRILLQPVRTASKSWSATAPGPSAAVVHSGDVYRLLPRSPSTHPLHIDGKGATKSCCLLRQLLLWHLPLTTSSRDDALREEVECCSNCTLAADTHTAVFGEGGPGATSCSSEAPSYHEDQQGRPFVAPGRQAPRAAARVHRRDARAGLHRQRPQEPPAQQPRPASGGESTPASPTCGGSRADRPRSSARSATSRPSCWRDPRGHHQGARAATRRRNRRHRPTSIRSSIRPRRCTRRSRRSETSTAPDSRARRAAAGEEAARHRPQTPAWRPPTACARRRQPVAAPPDLEDAPPTPDAIGARRSRHRSPDRPLPVSGCRAPDARRVRRSPGRRVYAPRPPISRPRGRRRSVPRRPRTPRRRSRRPPAAGPARRSRSSSASSRSSRSPSPRRRRPEARACWPLQLQPPALVTIEGDLGTGKTTLVRELLRARGVRGAITSPSFTLAQSYRGRDGEQLHHLDLYRLSRGADVDLFAWDDYLGPRAITLVEWPAAGSEVLPAADVALELEHRTRQSRAGPPARRRALRGGCGQRRRGGGGECGGGHVILALETATTGARRRSCAADGAVVAERVSLEGPAHAQRLLPFVEQVFADAGVGWDEVATVAVGLGPGRLHRPAHRHRHGARAGAGRRTRGAGRRADHGRAGPGACATPTRPATACWCRSSTASAARCSRPCTSTTPPRPAACAAARRSSWCPPTSWPRGWRGAAPCWWAATAPRCTPIACRRRRSRPPASARPRPAWWAGRSPAARPAWSPARTPCCPSTGAPPTRRAGRRRAARRA